MSTYSAWFKYWRGQGCSYSQAHHNARVCGGATCAPLAMVAASSIEIVPWVEVVSDDAVQHFTASGNVIEVNSKGSGLLALLRANLFRALGRDPGRVIDARGGKRIDM